MGYFWQGVMVSPPEGAKECTECLNTCNPPGYWKTALPQLWKEPAIATVMNPLDSLDGTSAPGMDGIPAVLYQTFAAHFALGCCKQQAQSTKQGISQRNGRWE